MNNKKIRLVVELSVNEESLQDKGISIEDVVDGIRFYEHDAIDGFEITTNIPGCDCSSDFFLCGGNILKKELVCDKHPSLDSVINACEKEDKKTSKTNKNFSELGR